MDIQLQVKHNIGNTITINNNINFLAKTYITDNIERGSVNILVENATDFSAGKLLLASDISSENAEFLESDSIDDESTIIVTGATLFNHQRGDAVYLAEYNKIVLESSTSANGAFTLVGEYDVQVTSTNTIITHTSGTKTTYYRAKLKNSVTGDESSYSPVASVALYSPESVGAMFDTVKTMFGISEYDNTITTTYLLSALNDARNLVNSMFANFKHSWREVFEYPVNIIAGRNYIDLPDDYDFPYNNGQLLSVRYPRINGLAPYPLTYLDKREWNTVGYSLKYSYTVGEVLSGATSIPVQNAGDFQTSGTVFLSANNTSEDIMQVTYTGVDMSTNTLTGCSGITRNIPNNTQLFAFPTFAQATYYTVWFDETTQKGRIVFNRPAPNVMKGRLIYIDYYKKMNPVTDINQVLSEPFRQVYVSYLKYAIKYRRDNKVRFDTDPDIVQFKDQLEQWLKNHYIGQLPKIITR